MNGTTKRAKDVKRSVAAKLRAARNEAAIQTGLLRLRTEERDELVQHLARVSDERDGARAALRSEAERAAAAVESARSERSSVDRQARRIGELEATVKAQERDIVTNDQRIADLERSLDEARAAVTRLVSLHHVADAVSVRTEAS
jgi:chromosome segregation ATPase